MNEDNEDEVCEDRLHGWYPRLLGCLSDQLSHNSPTDFRSSILLSLIARLNLTPLNGDSNQLQSICDSLSEFLSTVSLSEVISQTQPLTLLNALTHLPTIPHTPLAPCDDDDEGADAGRETTSQQHRISPKKGPSVFFSEYLLQEDSDGFSISYKDHPPMLHGDNYDLDDATLCILHDMCVADIEETHSVFECVAYSLSIIPRISNFTNNNRFSNIIDNFMHTLMPDVSQVDQFSNWVLLSSLLVKGALYAAKNEICIERRSKSLSNVIEFSIAFVKHVTDNIGYGLKESSQEVDVINSNKSTLLYSHFDHIFKFLTWTIESVSLPFCVSLHADRQLSVCLSALSVLQENHFVDTIRDICAIINEIGISFRRIRDTFQHFTSSLYTLFRALVESVNQNNSLSKSLPQSTIKVHHSHDHLLSTSTHQLTLTSHSPSTEFETGSCAFAYLYRIFAQMLANCSDRTMLDVIIYTISTLPAGLCPCISKSSVISSLFIEPLIHTQSSSVLNALIVHLRFSTQTKLIIEDVSPEIIESLAKMIQCCGVANIDYILRLLSIIFPDLSGSNAERLCDRLVYRCLALQEKNEVETDNDSQLLENKLILFLASHIIGKQDCSLITRKILIPFLKRTDDCTDLFTSYIPLFRTILLLDSTVAEHVNELCSALCARMERDLSVGRSDIWTLIAAREFSMPLLSVADLLYAFISKYNLTDLSESLMRRLRGCNGVFIDVCLDWIQSSTNQYSHLNRIGTLFAVTTAIVLSCERLSSMVQFMEQLESDTISSIQSPVSLRLIYCLTSALFDYSLEPLMKRPQYHHHSCIQCQSLHSVCEHEFVERARMQFPSLSLMAIGILSDAVKRCSQLSDSDEYYIKCSCRKIKTLSQLTFSNLDTYTINNMIDRWQVLIENLVCTSVSVDCFGAVLDVYSNFISFDNQSNRLKVLIKLIRKAPHLQLTVLEILLGLVEKSAIEPSECIAFPQSALADIPLDNENDERPDNVAADKNVLKRSLPSTSLFMSTLEKFFSLTTDDSKKTCSPRSESQDRRQSPSSSIVIVDDDDEKSMLLGTNPDETDKESTSRSSPFLRSSPDISFAAELSLGSPFNVFLSDGISVSFWIRLNAPLNKQIDVGDEPRRISICSLGSIDYSFSLLLSPDAQSVYIVNMLNGCVVMRKRLRYSLTASQWTHCVISFIVEQGMYSVNVTMNSHSTNLTGECPPISNLSSKPFIFAFGALENGPDHTDISFDLSTIFAFKGALSSQYALLLRALGCECCSLAETRVINNLNVALNNLINPPTVLSPSISILSLLGDTEMHLSRLQRSFLFVIRSSSAHSFGVSILQPGIDAQVAISEGDGSVLGLTMLQDYPIYWRCRIAQQQILSIEHLFIPLGSVHLFFFLFAQTVDMHCDSDVQSIALRLLMTFSHRTPSSMSEFIKSSGYAIIARCLSSQFAFIDLPVVNEVLRWCISELEWKTNEVARPTPLSLIIDPDLICALFCCADIWKGNDRFVHWIHLAETIAVCLSDTFARCFDFNTAQLVRVRFLTELFNTCNIMLQDARNFHAEHGEAVRLVKSLTVIISCLIGSPETTDAVIFLWHFILLSHPAADAFLQYNSCGHNDWIKSACISELRMDIISGQSALALRLNDYVRLLGAGYVADCWTRQRSVISLRSAYETALQKSVADEESRSSSSASPSASKQLISQPQQQDQSNHSVLPDLVKGIEQELIQESAGEDTTADEDDMNNLEHNADGREDSECHWTGALRCGAIELLSVVIQNGTDSLIMAILHDAISWQSIIVLLSNQDDVTFRDSVFVLLQNVLLRSPCAVRVSFVKNNGFAILANHIRSHPITSVIANTLFSVLCGEYVRLDEGLDSTHLQQTFVDNFTCSVFDAIFVMWEECVTVSDLSLFWNVTSALLKIYEVNSLLMQAMIDAHLCETLVNILRRIALLPEIATDLENVSSLTPLIESWSLFAKRIIITCVPYNDTHHYEMCQRFVWLLEFALVSLSDDESEQTRSAVNLIRSELCSLLSCWLITIHNVYADEGLSASVAPSNESIDTLPNGSSSAGSSFRDDQLGDIENEGIGPSLASTLQGVSPMSSFFTDSFSNLREKMASLGDQMKCRYKWRYRVQLAPLNENINRTLFCLEACLHLFTAIPSAFLQTTSDAENSLFEHFLGFLFSTWKRDQDIIAMRPGASSRAQSWAHLLAACRDRARLYLGQLIAFVLFPAERKIDSLLKPSCRCSSELNCDAALTKRMLLVRSLANDLPYKNTLKTLLDINLDYQYAMNLALHELALCEDCLNAENARDVEKLIRFLRNLQIESPLSNLAPERLMCLTTDESLALHGYVDHRNLFIQSLRERVTAICEGERISAEPISNNAMSLTCEVVDEQNLSRKLFLRSCHCAETSCVYAERIISALSVQLCHPEAVCFDEKSWPLSWTLDPTEGPNRERRRLKADHLNFDLRFVQPEFAFKLENRERPFPLSNLLCGRRTSPRGWSMMETLADDERIRVSLPAKVVRSTVESLGEVLLGDVKFYFFGDDTRSTQKGVSHSTVMIAVWEYSSVVEIYKRHHLLKDIAVEIFLSDGQTFLIVFEEQANRDHFMSQLLSMDLSNLINSPQNLHSITQLWRDGAMTNFEYLMQLNKLAGRSFNDLMQYPVFPFVLSNYSSTIIDLTDASSYRNLSKPMAVQNKRMESHYLGVYACLEAEANRSTQSRANPHSPVCFGPYHYGSHYSNSGIVVHYLVRLPPFTDIALEYQDNNFDIADRLFNSVETTWRLSSSDSTTDFKELIPEFFYLPEFLVNNEHLNMGIRQNGDVVNDVVLPKWCGGSARLFTLIHRQALESSIVTANLHSWIDLIFGYKQSGQAAIQAINVFHPATYRGGILEDATEKHDHLSLSALRTMVRTYGQMPIQLFHSPHLPHLTAKSSQYFKTKSPNVLSSVNGIRWGEFVGSPESESGTPIVVLKQRGTREMGHISHLFVTPDGSCYAYPDKTLFLPQYKVGFRSRDLVCSALLSWRFTDTVMRFRTLGASPSFWVNLIDLQTFSISAIAYSASDQLLFIGLSSAIIQIYRISFNAKGLEECKFETTLYGHESEVCTISVCSEYAIMVSGCVDGKVCVWDVNRLSFVRTLVGSASESAKITCISPVTADIAVVFQSGYGSRVCLYTVNGERVGCLETDITVTALGMTSLAEGTAVNCLALGMQNGIVRLLDMWTLNPVRDIFNYNFLEPIVSMSFASRCTRLFVCLASGSVLCWQGENMVSKRHPSLTFLSANNNNS